MKKYHVYGMGNALVDMEIEVSEDFLDQMDVKKGLMTLVDEARQKELLNRIGKVQHKRSCGGSAANTSIAVAQLGGKVFYSCKVANDETGEFYFRDLVEAGVHTNLSRPHERVTGTTGKCMVFITPDADRTMNTYLGITERFSKQELDEPALINSECLYIEGYLVTSETGRQAAIHARKLAKQHGVKTALTFSDPGIVSYFKDGFIEMLGDDGVDILFCNEHEAMSFTGASSPELAAQALKKYARSFAITMGGKGALLYDGVKEIHLVLVHKVEAVDTNGAGDLFAGAFLYGLTHGHSFADSGRLACQAASKLVTQFGPRLRPEQTQKVKADVLGE